jgi:hypothetical protein
MYPREPGDAEPGFVLGQFISAWFVVCRSRPEAVHAHWLIPQGLVIALLSLACSRVPPFLVVSHGADLYALRGRIWRWLKRFVARRAAAITGVN